MDASMLPRSPLASYSFSSEGSNLRVCYQDPSGNIKQSIFDKSGWHTSPRGVVGKADLNNGLAITGWSSGNEERVYYIGGDNTIVERCYSGGKSGWYDGELNGRFTAAHYSSLSAFNFTVNGTFCIRVYYQDKDNIIREVCRDGSEAWFSGQSFPAAIQGTGISCTCIPGMDDSHWLFYQKPDTTFGGHVKESGKPWRVGQFKSQLVYDPGAYITCASYREDNKDRHRVFTIDRDNKLCVTEYNAGWAATKQLTGTIPFSPAAATPVVGRVPCVRVYVQTNPAQISEWGSNDGTTYSLMTNPLPTN